jgi:hypothetical protein
MFRDCKTSSVFAWYVALLQNQHGAEWVLVRETRPAVDHNCNPVPVCVARSIPARIRSIEGTASSSGPQRITTATRPGVRCSIGPGSHSIHRGNRVESRPRGSQLQPRPGVRCSMFRDCKTSSVFAWYVALLQNQHGAEWVLVRETRPAADHNCNPVPVCVARSMFRDCKYNPTRKETLLCLWFCSGSALSLVRIVSALCPQSSGHFADVVRLSLGWRSPRRGTIKPLEPWVSKLQRVPACVARSVPARIRSIEGTASSPGPVDHNCNPVPVCVARCSAIAKPVAFLLGM